MRAIFAVCVTLGWSSSAYAGASSPLPSCLEGKSWTVPMRVENNRFVVNVKLNGKPVEAVFDTAAVTNLAPEKLAKAVNLVDAQRSMTMVPPGGSPVQMEFYGGTFDIGGKVIPDKAFVLSETGDRGKHDRILMAITAVLPYDFYLDTANGSFSVLDPSSCNSDYVPFSGHYSVVSVSASKSGQTASVPIAINGVTFKALFDTGANSTNISIDAAHSLGITDDDLRKGRKTSFTILKGAKAEGYIQKVDSINFGGVTYNNWEVGVSNSLDDVTLGANILKDFNIFVAPNRAGLFLQSHTE